MAEDSNTSTSGKGKKGGKRITKTTRAGLAFNVGKVLRLMKAGKYSSRVSPLGAIVLTATLEYMVAELLEVAGDVAKDEKKKIIKPRHIMLATKRDNELDRLLQNVTFPHAGNVPNVHPNLFPNKKKKKKGQ